MNNEIQRKLTSLTLMAIMFAGGMTIAFPGMEPAVAATDELTVSAQEVGNFAGIQVIEIVIDDPDRSDTSESQGIPNVELNGDDVLMAQANDGAWYAYVVNQIAINTFDTNDATYDIDDVYGVLPTSNTFTGSDAVNTFLDAKTFLDGYKGLSSTVSEGGVFATGDATLSSTVGEVNATSTITVNTPLESDIESFETVTASSEIAAGNILTIDDQTTAETFTAVSGATSVFEYDIDGAGTDIDLAALVLLINNESTIVDAELTSTNTVTLTAKAGTTATVGNGITSVVTVNADLVATASPLSGGTDADFFTLDGLTYTAVVGTANVDGSEFSIDSGTDALIADEIAAAIDIQDVDNVFADSTTTPGVVLLEAEVAGATGNGITLSTSDSGTLAVTGDTSGGVTGDTITINGITYTAVVGTEGDNTKFSIDGGNVDDANALAAAITSKDSSTVLGTTIGTAVVTITATNSGSAGNSITLAETGTISISGPNLTGGVTGTSTFDNNPEIESTQWPFIQSYDISDNSIVTITYGTGQTAETVNLTYDYDDDKDASMDRIKYPDNSYIFVELDDSLLNLSPTADDYWTFDGVGGVNYENGAISLTNIDWEAIGFEEGPVTFDAGTVYVLKDTEIHPTIKETAVNRLILRESNDNDNIFVNYDRSDVSNLLVTGNGEGSLTYNDSHSVVFDSFNGMIKFIGPVIEEWLSGVELTVQLTDEDRNLNSKIDEDLTILGGEVPFIKLGDPITITNAALTLTQQPANTALTITSSTRSQTANVEVAAGGQSSIIVSVPWPTGYGTAIDAGFIFGYVNYDFKSLGGTQGTFFVGDRANNGDGDVPGTVTDTSDATNAIFTFPITSTTALTPGTLVFDILFFGQQEAISIAADGSITENVDRVNDAFYRFELEETDDNTAQFEGTVEYIMINQLNVNEQSTYDKIDTTGDDVVIIVNDDLDGADAVRVSYLDFDSTENDELISVQEDANTHSGKITLDKPNYSSGNTITVTLEDSDLNTDSDTVQSYDVDSTNNWIGDSDVWLVQMLIDDIVYNDACAGTFALDLDLLDTGITFTETSKQSGIFEGTLKLPTEYCTSTTTKATTNGVDIEFEYQDYSDASGKPNETSDSASITSNTGSVSFDRTVYPVPFDSNDFPTYDSTTDFLPSGDVKVVIHVDDPDSNLSASGEDTLDVSTLALEIARGSLTQTISLAGLEAIETDPQSGIFEVEVFIPQQSYQFLDNSVVQQGDILTVTYTDPNDASGSSNTVTDSATFDLRNGVLQTDKSVYLVGSDAIITLIEPDLNLDSEAAETWSLDLINWDSDAGDVNLSDDIFDAQPSGLRETGDNTGIFQVVIEIPQEIGGDKLERGEQIELEYQDQGPAGADYVGDDDEDINVTIFTSNFGATVELDQKVYTWTDKVYVTIVAPDHNFDSDSIDEIGTETDSEISIRTRSAEIDKYKLVETGTDTGIFTGEVILTGFTPHDADGDGIANDVDGLTSGSGPTGGRIGTSSDDGITISFEFSDGEIVLGSSLIRWNIGEVQWLEASYPASGTGVIRVIDNDMNLNPEAVDNFEIDVWSDTAAGGISLRVTETNEATGIFEGTVSFTTTSASSGSRLAVSEGDTVTAEYEDNTLPDPYSNADELDVSATTLIGTLVPPLDRAPAANLRAVDAFGNSLSSVQVDQQVQVTADLSNGQERNQEFAYLLQVQNQDGVTVSLSWITGSLNPGQAFSPAVSWIPTEVGTYDATVFVWESVDNPTALSPPVTTTITVN